MPRLIDADKLKDIISDTWILDRIDEQPTVDAMPVRYGKWLDADDGIDWTCSRCGHDAWANTPYCPNCGARMNVKIEDEDLE